MPGNEGSTGKQLEAKVPFSISHCPPPFVHQHSPHPTPAITLEQPHHTTQDPLDPPSGPTAGWAPGGWCPTRGATRPACRRARRAAGSRPRPAGASRSSPCGARLAVIAGPGHARWGRLLAAAGRSPAAASLCPTYTRLWAPSMSTAPTAATSSRPRLRCPCCCWALSIQAAERCASYG